MYRFLTLQVRYTLKVFTVTLPNGPDTLVSEPYVGRTSDTHITLNYGFLDRTEPGNAIIADRVFL